MKYLKVGIFIIILFGISVFTGQMLIGNIDETVIYLEGDAYTFRDSEGHRISAIEKDGITYLPVVDDFLFLDYSVQQNGSKIELIKEDYPDNIDFNTETLDGELFTTENLFDYEYSILLNWTTWCPDCKEFLESLSKYSDKLKEENIQIIGLPIGDTDGVSDIMSKYNLDFKNLVVTEDMRKQLQSNIENVPSVIIVDYKGKIVYDNEDIDLLFDTVFEDMEELEFCGEC